jgi:hypothetical protein
LPFVCIKALNYLHPQELPESPPSPYCRSDCKLLRFHSDGSETE